MNNSLINSRSLALGIILILLIAIAGCKSDRLFFRAKFEPKNQVLVGAGQVDPADFLSFSKAMDNQIKPIIFMDYLDAHDQNLNKSFDSLEVKQKSIPWKTWLQLGLAFVDEHGKPSDSLAATGFFDDHLRIIAQRLKQLQCPVYLRIGYEFHGRWNGYSPVPYIKTFRRVVDILKEMKVKNVATVWCAEAGELPGDYMKFYPGDEYVDWWGIDLFSAGDILKTSTIEFTGNAASHKKPVMIGESTPRNTTTLKEEASWNEWFVPYFQYIETNRNVKAFCYINWDWVKYGKMWSVDWISWGDCRIEKSKVIPEKLKEKLKNKLYSKNN
jgi:hypothetical protein